jgi:DNA-binding LytR/AlgR family response regulator
MRCLVVDDDGLSRTVLEHFIAQHDGLTLVGSFTNAVEAANSLQQDGVDLAFVDIEMPEMSGLELIQSAGAGPQFIVVSIREDYAVEAFNVEVTDYLLKPVRYPRFLKAVERARRRNADTNLSQSTSDYVFVKTEGRLVKLDLQKVLWIEAQGDYACIHMDGKSQLVHSRMKTLENRLPPRDFVRVHRSFIVRIEKVSDIGDTTLVIDRHVIPIGPRYRDALLGRLNTL